MYLSIIVTCVFDITGGYVRFSDTCLTLPIYLCTSVKFDPKYFLMIAYLFHCILCKSIHVKKKINGKIDPVLLLVSLPFLLLFFNVYKYMYGNCLKELLLHVLILVLKYMYMICLLTFVAQDRSGLI